MPSRDSYKNSLLLVIEYSNFDSLIDDLLVVTEKMGKDYEFEYRTDAYAVPNLKFGKVIRRIKQLRSRIQSLLFENSILISSIDKIAFKATRFPSKNPLENVELHLEEIQILYKGLSNPEIITIDNATQVSPYNDSVAVNFFMNCKEISKAYYRWDEKTTSYRKFIDEYYYYPVTPTPLSPVEQFSQLEKGPSSQVSGLFSETIPQPKNPDEITTFEENIEEIGSEKKFSTKEDLQKFNQFLKNENINARRVATALNTIDSKDAQLAKTLRDGIAKAGTINEFYKLFTSKYDLKTIKEVFQQYGVSKIKASNLGPTMMRILAVKIVRNASSVYIAELYFDTVLRIGRQNTIDLSQNFTEKWNAKYGSRVPPIPLPTNLRTEDDILEGYYRDTDLSNIVLASTRDITPEEAEENIQLGIPKNNEAKDIQRIKDTFVSLIQEDPDFDTPEFLRSVKFIDPSAREVIDNLIGIDVKKPDEKILSKLSPNNIRDSFTIPYIPKLVPPFSGFGDVQAIAIQLSKKAREVVILNVLKALGLKFASSLLDMALGQYLPTDSFGFSGTINDSLASLDAGKNPDVLPLVQMREYLSMPESATDRQVAGQIYKILNTYSVPRRVDNPPSDDDVLMFLQKTSDTLSPQELIDLYTGNASERTVKRVSYIIQNDMQTEAMLSAFPTDEHVVNLFSALGLLINKTALQESENIRKQLENNYSQGYCETPMSVMVRDEELKDSLRKTGLTDEEIEQRMKEAIENAIKDLENILSGAIDPTPDVSQFSDPTVASSDTKFLDEFGRSYEFVFVNDLALGDTSKRRSKGFLDMILSSVKRRPGKAYSKLSLKNRNREQDQIVSSLKGYLESLDFIESLDSDKIKITYFSEPEKRSTLPDQTMIYNYGTSLAIQEDKNPNVRNIPVYNESFAKLEAYSQEVAPDNNGRDIFSKWVKSRLQTIIREKSTKLSITESTISNILTNTENIMTENFKDILATNLINTIKKVSLFGTDSWVYGRGGQEFEVFDANEEEFGAGSWYIVGKSVYTGWRKVYNESVPTEERSSEDKVLFNFESESKRAKEYYKKIPEDDRVTLPQEIFEKLNEKPFSRANSKINNALLAELIMTTIKTYVIDAFLKGSPFFRTYQLNDENYASLLKPYLVDSILNQVLIESYKTPRRRWKSLRAKGYYYIFVEQLVQAYSNMVSEGMIKPSSQAEESLKKLNKRVLDSWKPTSDNDFVRTAQFKKFIDDSLPLVKPILMDLVSICLDTVGKETFNVYSPEYPTLNSDVYENWISSEVYDIPANIGEETDIISGIRFSASDDLQSDFSILTGEIASREQAILNLEEEIKDIVFRNKKNPDNENPKNWPMRDVYRIFNKLLEEVTGQNVENESPIGLRSDLRNGEGASKVPIKREFILDLFNLSSFSDKQVEYLESLVTTENLRKLNTPSERSGLIASFREEWKGYISDKEKAVGITSRREDLRVARLELVDLKNDFAKVKKLPFVYQRYYKLIGSEGHLVVPVVDFDYGEIKREGKYSKVMHGIRLCYYPGKDYTDNVTSKNFDIFSDIFSTERVFNMIPLYSYEYDATSMLEDVLKGVPASAVGAGTTMLASGSPSSETSITDSTFFEVEPKMILDDESLKSILHRQTGSDLLIQKCLLLPDILSTLTIYSIENFVDSIIAQRGNKRDVRRWNERTFGLSKDFLKTMTEQCYYARTPQYAEEISKEQESSKNRAFSSINLSSASSIDPDEREEDDVDNDEEADLFIKSLPRWRRKLQVPAQDDEATEEGGTSTGSEEDSSTDMIDYGKDLTTDTGMGGV